MFGFNRGLGASFEICERFRNSDPRWWEFWDKFNDAQ